MQTLIHSDAVRPLAAKTMVVMTDGRHITVLIPTSLHTTYGVTVHTTTL